MRWRWRAGTACVSYGELAARAGRLAGLLAGRGRGRSRWWGCAWSGVAEMVTAILGVWLAGAAYLPLDPGYPAARLGYMLAGQRGRGWWCAGAGCRAGWPPPGAAVVDLADPRAAAGPAGGGRRRCRAVRAAGQLAYVIYTSGSTGAPKGVAVPHGGLANLAAGLGPVLGAGPGARVLQFASFSFDASVLDVAVTLAAGGVAGGRGAAADRAEPARLAGWCGGPGSGAASVVPSLLAGAGPGRGCRGCRGWWPGARR